MNLSHKVIPNIKGTITKLHSLLFTTCESIILNFFSISPHVSTQSVSLLLTLLCSTNWPYHLTVNQTLSISQSFFEQLVLILLQGSDISVPNSFHDKRVRNSFFKATSSSCCPQAVIRVIPLNSSFPAQILDRITQRIMADWLWREPD